jgi:hypothetical protein
MVYALFREDTYEAIKIFGELTIQIALCFIGVGEVTAALRVGNALGIFAGVADVTLGVIGATINTIPEISRNHPDFVKYTNYAIIAYGLARLGYAGYKAVKVDKIVNDGKYAVVEGYFGSKVLTKEELLVWEKDIKILNKEVKLIRASTSKKATQYLKDNPDVAAYFDALEIPPTVFYKEGVTKYVIQHEYYHVEEFTFLGKDEFLAGVYGTPDQRILNEFLREKYVYKRILENNIEFNVAELKHAHNYYFEKLLELYERKIEIKPEYILKPFKN